MPFRAKKATHATFPIDRYRLDEPVGERAGLIEFSPAEYAEVGRQFRGEKDYNGPPVPFLGRSWMVKLQTVQGQICKIALYRADESMAVATPIARHALEYCTKHLGEPATARQGQWVWDAADGNVILMTGESADGFVTSLFLTSGAIRKFPLATDNLHNDAFKEVVRDATNDRAFNVVFFLLNCTYLLAGYLLHFEFIAWVLVGMFSRRRWGWWLSKRLYVSSLPIAIVVCIGWGAFVALLLHHLIVRFNPSAIAMWFAYGAGAYVSIPNFGLIAEATIPASAQPRHTLIEVVPFVTYVVVCVWLALA
jgi:hypothetical protein